MPSFAGDEPHNDANHVRPDSVTWGGSGVTLTNTTAVTNTSTTSSASSAVSKRITARPDSVTWGSGSTLTNTIAATNTSTTTTASAALSSADAKIAVDVNNHVGSDGTVTVIVQHRQMPSTAHLRDLQSRGATIRGKFRSIRAVVMHVPATMLDELAQDPNVVYMTPDRQVSVASNPQTEEFATAVEENVAQSNYGMNGSGIGVAVIDSGIADHPDLHNAYGYGPSRVIYSQSFVAGNSSPVDQFGHGTHVAGLIGGNGASSGSSNGYPAVYAGMAPNVNLINLRVLDQNGLGTDSQVIAAIEEAINLPAKYNVSVINMSLGRPIFESYTLDPVDQAVEAAWKAGIVVVAAAGNNGRYAATDGFGTIGVPANDPSVITVGATLTMQTPTRVDDEIASYSSKGPTAIDHIVKPDIVAPGNRQVSLRVPGSTLDTLYPQFELWPTSGTAMYYVLSGTSMATPIVSGAVAQMVQQNQNLTPDQIKARLMKTAWKGFGQFTSSEDYSGNLYNNEYDIFTYGAGYLDINAALGNTNLASGIALSPTAVFNPSTDVVTIVNTAPDSNFSGSSVVWNASSVVWSDSIVWGSGTILSDSIVWGATSIVWGSASVSGDSIVWGGNGSALSATSALALGDPGDNN